MSRIRLFYKEGSVFSLHRRSAFNEELTNAHSKSHVGAASLSGHILANTAVNILREKLQILGS